MQYTNEIKKKAGAFANAIANKDIRIRIVADAKYMTAENQVILFNFLADFDAEHKISEKFQKWLKNKALIQTELFE